MTNPSIKDLQNAAKQARENASLCEDLIKLDSDSDGFYQSLFDYHSLAAEALTRWADELCVKKANINLHHSYDQA